MLNIFPFRFCRDTPHHLKNKRVQQGALTEKAANILISHAIKQQEQHLTLLDKSIPEVAETKEESLNGE